MKLNEVTQGALEAYEGILLGEGSDRMSAARFNRIVILAALDAGFAEDTPADLMACKPYEIKEMTRDILAHIAAAKAPPDPN